MRNPLAVLSLILVLCAMQPAQARQISFSAGPPRSGALNYKLELAPGQSSKQQVRINNASDEPLQFRIYTGQAISGRNGALDGPLYGQPVTGVGTWLTTEKSSVTIGAGSRAEVSFEVAVPPGTAPGDHVGFVFVDVAPESLDAADVVTPEGTSATPEGDEKASFRMRVSTRFALAVVVRVPGQTRAELTLDAVKKFVRDGRLGLRFEGHNSGNVYLKPSGRWVLKGPAGEVVASQEREPWGVLLPGAAFTREIAVKTDRPLVRGTYSLQVEASYQDPDAPEGTAPLSLSRSLEITLP
jgi:hypothetical protein